MSPSGLKHVNWRIGLSVYKSTEDDWYPPFPNKTVKVIMFRGSYEDGWYVRVWGADDMGVEKNFEKKGDALCLFMSLISLKYVNIQDTIDFGMEGI